MLSSSFFQSRGVDLRELLNTKMATQRQAAESTAGLAAAQAMEARTRAGLAPAEAALDRRVRLGALGVQQAAEERAGALIPASLWGAALPGLVERLNALRQPGLGLASSTDEEEPLP